MKQGLGTCSLMKGDTLENYNEYKKNNIVSENIF